MYLHTTRTLRRLRDLQRLENGRKIDTKVSRRELLDRLLLSLHDGRQGRVAGLYETLSIIRESSGNKHTIQSESMFKITL